MSLHATAVVRIITEPKLKAFESGTMVCNFVGGIQEGKDKQGNWIKNSMDVEVWGKAAEVVIDKLRKGDCILVNGSIKMQEWTDKEGGTRRKHVLSVQRFEFLPHEKSQQEEPF